MYKLFKKGNIIKTDGIFINYVYKDLSLKDKLKLKLLYFLVVIMLPIQFIFDKWSYYNEKENINSLRRNVLYSDIFR